MTARTRLTKEDDMMTNSKDPKATLEMTRQVRIVCTNSAFAGQVREKRHQEAQERLQLTLAFQDEVIDFATANDLYNVRAEDWCHRTVTIDFELLKKLVEKKEVL
jgi:hypothetical protein